MRRSKIGICLLALCVPATGLAQSINRELTRYQLRQADCRDAYRARLTRSCGSQCQQAAEATRDRCLARAERRYTEALRIQLRPPDRPD